MPDPLANAAPAADPVDPVATAVAAAVAAERQKYETLEGNYKAAQRNLERQRRAGESTAALASRIDALQALLTPLITASPDIDDTVKAKAVAQLKGTEKADDTTRTRAAAEAASILSAVGITDESDPRIAGVVDAMVGGQYISAVMEASRVAGEVKAAKPAAPNVSALVAAEVEKVLRERGERRVDTQGGAPKAVPTPDTILQQDIRGMTASQLAAHQEQLYAILEKRTGVKFKR